jgi:hypothetical protein
MPYRRGKAWSCSARAGVCGCRSRDAGGRSRAPLLVSVKRVSKVLNRRWLTGERTACPRHGRVPAELTTQHAAVREQVRQCGEPRPANCGLDFWTAATFIQRQHFGQRATDLKDLG